MEKATIKECVYGLGGVGGHLGELLAHSANQSKNDNHEVYFIARGRHLDSCFTKLKNLVFFSLLTF